MKSVLVLILVFSFSSLGFGQAKSEKSDKVSNTVQELRALTNKWNEAEVRGDAATIDNLLADEFSFLGGSDRSQYLALMKPDPSLVIESSTIEDQKVQIYGETAIVTGLNSYKAKKDDKPFEGKFLSMTVWVKREGRWKCVQACIHSAGKN